VRTAPGAEGTASGLRVLRRADYLPPGESVVVRDDAVLDGVAAHLHDFYEIALITAGAGRHVSGTRSEPLAPGDVLLVHPSVPHAFSVAGPAPLLVRNVLFTEAALEGLLDAPEVTEVMGAFLRPRRGGGVPRLAAADAADVAGDLALAALMAEESRRREPGHRAALRGHLAALLVRLWRRYRRAAPEPGDAGAWARLLPVVRRLHETAGVGVRVADLAAAAGWSPDHFGRLFRDAVGESPQAFLRRLRIHRAAVLLLAGGEPVEDVARAAGYSDARALRRAFAACFGTTPDAYRRSGLRGEAQAPPEPSRDPSS
jgi:AraC-like DNA-binding protein/mannose-6-phosphate isomerase-like protein (cupin superfamily)